MVCSSIVLFELVVFLWSLFFILFATSASVQWRAISLFSYFIRWIFTCGFIGSSDDRFLLFVIRARFIVCQWWRTLWKLWWDYAILLHFGMLLWGVLYIIVLMQFVLSLWLDSGCIIFRAGRVFSVLGNCWWVNFGCR